MNIDTQHLSAVERLHRWDALARHSAGFEVDNVDGIADELEVDAADVAADPLGAFLGELLDVSVFAGSHDRRIVQGLMTTGGPHIDWQRESWNGAVITISTYWGGEERHTSITAAHLAAMLDTWAEAAA